MDPLSPGASRLTVAQWLIIVIASIGFAFDTYELLMTPLVGVPGLAEVLGVPPNNPLVTRWMGNLLWITALCGGVFGLLGGWLTDRLGRKTVMAASIFVYSFSPVLAAFSTTLFWFVFFRCCTFVGVCVEFVAAVTWLAEIFPDKKQKERWLGITQAFASVGGVMVTSLNAWIIAHAGDLPALPLPAAFHPHAAWRYTLLTGLIPALPIALMLPFVPESQVWKQKKRSGTLKRPSFAALFAPELRRVTLVTAALSACAFGVAFGALQLTPGRIAPGLPDLAEQQKALAPLRKEAEALNKQLNELAPKLKAAYATAPGLEELAGRRVRSRVEMRAAKKIVDDPKSEPAAKEKAKSRLAQIAQQSKALDAELDNLAAGKPDAKAAVIDREKILKQLGDNRDKQEPFAKKVEAVGNGVQLYQEVGGLAGRIALAVLLFVAISRRLLLRLFQLPGLAAIPLAYFILYHYQGSAFAWGIAAIGFLTVAQFSYFGEYLPKVFPLHLRATGGSFATNVGGRMIGTSMAFVTSNLLAPLVAGGADKILPKHLAISAGCVALGMVVIGTLIAFFLPEPKSEPPVE
ncbi:MAG: MFS transporter [Planctomycetia bacterium]|nr:MFS transporter [Planctomycetia bacterium]